MDPFIRDLNEKIIVPQLIKNIHFFNEQCEEGNSFKVLHLNVCGISTNFPEFLCFLEKFKEKIDIIVLTETHLIKDLQIFNIPGYSVIYNNGSFNKCDGVVVFVRESICMEFSFKFVGDVKCIELLIGENQEKFFLTCIYRSPSINDNIFLENFSEYLEFNHHKKRHIIVGDINLDLLKENKQCVEDYKSLLSAYGFTSFINKHYTRPLTRTCLDHMYVKGVDKNTFKNPKSFIISYKITDHHPIVFTFNNTTKKTETNIRRTKSYTDYQKLRTDLKNESWASVLLSENLNLAVTSFLQILQQKISQNTKTVKQTNTKNGKNKWITKSLLNEIETKNNLYKEILKNPQDDQLKSRYKVYKNQLSKSITRAKKDFAQKLISKNSNKSEALWKCVNKICNKPLQNTKIEKIELSNSEIVTDKKEIVNHFNNFFCEIGENLARDIAPLKDYTEKIDRSSKSLHFLRQTREEEVKKMITQLKTKKAPGPDKIRSETLKEIANEISPILTYLINLSFRTGDFPVALKLGEIKPLFKSGSKTEIGNYRPISLISNISKIFEKIIKQRVVTFLEKQKLISEKQFGFRAGKSTEDAIISLTHKIYEALDKRKPSLCVFIDLTKAFDTVCHGKLIQRLEQIGVRGSVLGLFRSYLSERRQYVKMDDVESDLRTVTCGVPQGTVLGPLLFTIYINSFLKTNWQGTVISFADDTAIFYTGDSWIEARNRAETDLNNILKWFQHNKLTLNQSKTKFVPFASYTNNLPEFRFLNIGDNIYISRTEYIKYLGIIVDQHIRWDKQINHILSKTRYLTTRFYHLKSYLTLEQLKNVYFALVQSQFNYGIAGWGSVRDCYLNKLEVLQKWILKIIFNKNKKYSSDRLFTEAKVLDIRQLYFFNILMLVHKNKIILHTVSHDKNTRYKKDCMVVPISRKEIGHKSINFLAPKFFNLLPNNLKEIIFLRSFKTKLKDYIWSVNRNEIRCFF